jgi:GR25 family glycosyltransferase involved in LPS biosynthesis
MSNINLLEHTLVINLDTRIDRLVHAKKELASIGVLAPERFPAIKNKHGAIGCSLSHIKCLEIAKSREWEYVFICEDDITFTNPQLFRHSLDRFQENSERDGIMWDLLLIGGNNCPPYNRIHNVDYCVQISNCQSTIGYVVRKSYYDTLISNFREGVMQLMRDPENKPNYAIDMYWKRLQIYGRWYLIVPLTVTQMRDYSDVEQREVNYDHLMLDLDKDWLMSRMTQQRALSGMTCFKRPGF